jgi:hypothetical protein
VLPVTHRQIFYRLGAQDDALIGKEANDAARGDEIITTACRAQRLDFADFRTEKFSYDADTGGWESVASFLEHIALMRDGFRLDRQTGQPTKIVVRSEAAGLNSYTAPLLTEYVEALRIPSGGRKLAVTDEERELATQLYEAHKDAFEAIAAAISGEADLDVSNKAAENSAST